MGEPVPEHSITIDQVEAFKFVVDFGPAFAPLTVDEIEPIGAGAGPAPEQLLIAGVANCLCASLAFALGKFRQEGGGIRARTRCTLARNADRRLRIAGITVDITLGSEAAAMPRIDRVLEQFQRFCTVSESVQAGIPVQVSVRDRAEHLLAATGIVSASPGVAPPPPDGPADRRDR